MFKFLGISIIRLVGLLYLGVHVLVHISCVLLEVHYCQGFY